jgi:UDP-glucose 4-epimerase
MLEGKRIVITGGAGFIGTTLARELVDRNEIVAIDNLHRDTVSGTELLDHPPAPAGRGDAAARVGVGSELAQGVHPGTDDRRSRLGPMLEGKRIVITGGAGFIATTLARELVDGNEIVAIDNLHRDALSGTELADHPNFTLHQGDVLDGDGLAELARGATHIVHCAAIAGVETVLESPVRTMRVNVIGTYNALEAALATNDTLERFVDFSTSEVFGTHAYNVSEGQVSTIGSVGEARWTYAVSKLAGEHMAHAYHDELRLPTVTVHPFNVYGPGQIGGGAIRAFIEAALAGDDLTVRGDGSQIRAWCYVSDMVAGVLACLERPEAVGQAFNVGNPRSSVTIYDLAQRVLRLTACPGRIVFAPLGYTDVELRIPNVEKARELLAWEPRVELDDGLARTIAWYRNRQPASV